MSWKKRCIAKSPTCGIEIAGEGGGTPIIGEPAEGVGDIGAEAAMPDPRCRSDDCGVASWTAIEGTWVRMGAGGVGIGRGRDVLVVDGVVGAAPVGIGGAGRAATGFCLELALAARLESDVLDLRACRAVLLTTCCLGGTATGRFGLSSSML